MVFSLTNLTNIFQAALNSKQFLFTVYAVSFSFKLGLLGYLFHKKLQNTKTPYQIYFLMLILFSSLVCDIPWLFVVFINHLDYRLYNNSLRLAWAFTIILYQTLSLFIEHLANKQFILTFRQKVFCLVSSTLVLTCLAIIIMDFNCLNPEKKSLFEQEIALFIIIYLLFPLMTTSIVMVIKKLQTKQIPGLLIKQIKLLTIGMIIPFWLSDFFQITSILIAGPYCWINRNYAFASINNIFITYAIFYSIRKIIQLRFLNLNYTVQTPINVNFMTNFKTILERLGHVTNPKELSLLVQEFFKESFNISFNKVSLYIRADQSPTETMLVIESFLATHSNAVYKEFFKQKIMVYDEMAFSNFYEQNESRSTIIQFLSNIQADIFLPIYEKDNLTAYIVVEKKARITHFYSQAEQDEMLIFTSYLSNIINLIDRKSVV